MAPHTSIIRERLNASRPIHCFKSNLPTMVTPQLLGGLGIDCLWFDQEHLPTDSLTMYGLILSSHAADADAVIRVPNGAVADAVRMLDAGADAIMYPRVRSPDEVAELVRWLRFAPVGQRGVDTMVPSNQFGAQSIDGFTAHANRENVLIIQIETLEALQQIEAIAAVPGFDLLFVGLADMAREMGVSCDPREPQLASAVKRVSEVARKHGLAWGMPAVSVEHAAELLQAGALFIAHGSDTSLLKVAVTKICKQMELLGIPQGRSRPNDTHE